MSDPPPHLTQQSVSSHVKSLATMLIINWLFGTFSALDTQDIFMRMFNYLTGRLIVWWVTTDCWNVETVDICNWVTVNCDCDNWRERVTSWMTGTTRYRNRYFEEGFLEINDTFLDNIRLSNMNENFIRDRYSFPFSFPCISSIQSKQSKCRCEKR